MVKKIKGKRSKYFSVGIRVEIPTKMLKKDLIKEYKKKFDQDVIFNLDHGCKIVPCCTKEVVLARPGEEKNMGYSSFAILVGKCGNLDSILRLVKIINILGDDKIIKEKIKTFVTGKSELNMLEELNPLIGILKNIESIIPGFIEVAWLLAPEAKLR